MCFTSCSSCQGASYVATLFATCEEHMCQTSSIRQVIPPELLGSFASQDIYISASSFWRRFFAETAMCHRKIITTYSGDLQRRINPDKITVQKRLIILARATPFLLLFMWGAHRRGNHQTAHRQTKNLDIRGFDSSRFLILREGIPASMGKFPEIQTQRFLACGFYVCGLTQLTLLRPISVLRFWISEGVTQGSS